MGCCYWSLLTSFSIAFRLFAALLALRSALTCRSTSACRRFVVLVDDSLSSACVKDITTGKGDELPNRMAAIVKMLWPISRLGQSGSVCVWGYEGCFSIVHLAPSLYVESGHRDMSMHVCQLYRRFLFHELSPGQHPRFDRQTWE